MFQSPLTWIAAGLGQFKNGGREWQPKGEPEEVEVHDFPDPQLGKVIPYGVFDLERE